MKKILIINTVGLRYDGITNVILSYLEVMDKQGLELYVTSTRGDEEKIKDKLEQLGIKIVELPSRRTDTMRYFIELIKAVRKNKIDVIHAHGNSATLAIEMVAGWMGSAKKRIAHSHNTKCEQVKADKLLRPLFNLMYSEAVACGNDAGKWLFKKRTFTVLPNGRDTDFFAYKAAKRNEKRNELDIEKSVAIGHVGGFFEQKNHRFLVKVFREILKREPSARLVLVGDGPLRNEIEFLVDDIRDNVIFVGTTPLVADYLQAMDGMLLPSLFEGLPLVAIEWQINGLPCVFSDTVTRECVFTEGVVFLSLKQSPEKWAKVMLDTIKNNNRMESSNVARKGAAEHSFDIRENVKILRNLYLS